MGHLYPFSPFFLFFFERLRLRPYTHPDPSSPFLQLRDLIDESNRILVQPPISSRGNFSPPSRRTPALFDYLIETLTISYSSWRPSSPQRQSTCVFAWDDARVILISFPPAHRGLRPAIAWLLNPENSACRHRDAVSYYIALIRWPSSFFCVFLTEARSFFERTVRSVIRNLRLPFGVPPDAPLRRLQVFPRGTGP